MNPKIFVKDFFELGKKELFFFSLLFVDTLSLLFFGKNYTTFEVIKHIHLHDIFLGFIFLVALSFKAKIKIKPIEVLIIISLFYLILSIPRALNLYDGWYVVVRQYMIFGYLMIGYVIVRAISSFNNGLRLAYKFIVIIGFFALFVQLVYVLYISIFQGVYPFLYKHFFSPITTMGMIVIGAYFLVNYRGIKGHIFFILTLILSITLGFDSAYLSLVVVYAMFFFLKVSPKIKIMIFIGFVICIILFFVFIPTFSDPNMMWRLIYWRDTISGLVKSNDIFFGKAFGVPYLEEYTREHLNNFMISNDFSVYITYEKGYEVSPHNSFISFVYHLGIFNFLLLLYPFRILFFKVKHLVEDKIIYTLILMVIGISVWASFNLILELPHSSSYYWIIFFTLLFILRKKSLTLKQ